MVGIVRAIYPNCGYSATNEKVRQFHSEFYRPENLTLIITSQVNIDNVAKALETFESHILSKEAKALFQRPWQTPVETLTESMNKQIVYASDSEDCGICACRLARTKLHTEKFQIGSLFANCLLRYMSPDFMATPARM